MNEFEMRRSLAQLPRSRAPERDLWPAIEARLDHADGRRLWQRWPWLALAAAAVLAVAMLPAQLGRIDPTQEPVPLAAAEIPVSTWPEAGSVVVGSAWALPAWVLGDPEVAAALAELEESTAELHHLIDEHPGASHLVSLLHANYRQHRWLNRFGVGQGRLLPPQET
ncbi:MAG TPA: hypothetical protein PKZ76_13035 [Xanthomonadaceae bacterium]|nr:hypothetical protein [Xanthomonadaceae bacterium]